MSVLSKLKGLGLLDFMNAHNGEPATGRERMDYEAHVQERVWDTIGAFTFRKTRARFGLSLTMDRPK